jgi:Arylsulfotransferase (ASST)
MPLVRALAGVAGSMAFWALAPGASASASGHAHACVPSKLNASAALAGSRLTVSPAPDTRDASAATQISLIGAGADQLSDISVIGSRSGAHSGRLLAYSQGDGASFLPTRSFRDGEQVTVHGQLISGAARVPFAWTFKVATRDSAAVAASGRPPPLRAGDRQSFRSRPDLKPPTVTVTTRSADAAPGDLFLAPYSGAGQYGPMILDGNGQLIWFKALPHQTRAADFRVQQYQGQPVLSWWQDPLDGASAVVIANSAYQQIQVVHAGNGYQPDLHEFQITPRGTALMTIYSAIRCDESSVGGPRDGAVADTLMQEIDLHTGLVRFEWHSLDHVALRDSYASAKPTSASSPFDFFHINAIDVEQDGSLLIDARNTWAAYDVSRSTGEVIWRLGGKHSSFALQPGSRPAWQHDARQQPDGAITFFDNGATPRIHPQSRAIELRLDFQHMTATLVGRYEHPTPLVAGSQGNVQAQPNGDWLVGWGEVPDFSELSPSGKLLFDAHLPAGYESYRTYRMPWSGQPLDQPAILVKPAPHGGMTVYASWNGATQVAAWRVLEGSGPSNLQPVLQQPRAGFQTIISPPAGGQYIVVQALAADGTVLAASPLRPVPVA